jgi:putative cardiolipin synthase
MKLLLTALLLSAVARADDLRFLRADRDALQARVDLIQEARGELLVEYFSVWNDDQSIGGMSLLVDAARRGVKVKVIVDALSTTVPKRTFAALLALGGENLEIKVYNPLSVNLLRATHRNHAKMLIADGEKIITGGRNVGDKYFGINRKRNFTDLDVIARGSVVARARENFLTVWGAPVVKKVKLGAYYPNRLAAPCPIPGPEQTDDCAELKARTTAELAAEKERILDILHEIKTVQDDDIVISNSFTDWFGQAFTIADVRFQSHEPETLVSKETATLNRDLLAAIAGAKRDVNIVSPYLIPTPALMKIFADLDAKGVRVPIITNSLNSTDNLLAQAGYRDVKRALIELGVELYEFNGPDTIHAKTAVIDDRLVLIGTYNIDPRSAFINREIGVIADDVENTGLARELAKIIDGFRATSTLVGKDKAVVVAEDPSQIPLTKRALLRTIDLVLPLIRNQL